MHNRTKTLSSLSLVLVLSIALPAAAQQMTKQSDNASHRFLPPGQRPSRDNFKTSEYLDALKQFRKLSQERKRPSSTPMPFEPSKFNPDQSTPAEIDPGFYDQLSPTDKRRLNRTSREAMSEVARGIGRDVVELNQQFRRRLGLKAEEDPEPSNKRFDLPEEVLGPYEQARKTLAEQRADYTNKYKQAMEAYKDQWPSERIPPDQWLNKVQPFINSEVIEQLKQYRAYQDGTTDKLPESAFQKPPKLDAAKRGLSGRMLESVVKTLDSGTNELIKRAKENKRSGKKQSSLWKRLKAAADKQLKTANKSITDRTERYAKSPAIARPRNSSPGTSSTSTSPDNSLAKILAAVALASGVAALIAYLIHLRKANQDEAYVATPIDPDSIRDRESLLRAIHNVAADRFGRSSRYWHHRKLFTEIKEHASRRTEDLQPLAKLYERARYAPNGQVSSEDLEVARRWYKDFRNAELVKS